MRLTIIAVTMTALLAGCQSQQFTETRETSEQLHAQINEQVAEITNKSNQIRNVARPPVRLQKIQRTHSELWPSETTEFAFNNMPLRQAVMAIVGDAKSLKGLPVESSFRDGINQMTPVTLRYSGNKLGALNALAQIVGSGLDIDEHQAIFSKFVSETFVIDLPVGEYSGQLGAGSSGSDTGVSGQYLSTAYKDVNSLNEIETAIKTLLRESNDQGGDTLVGSVNSIPSMSAIAVRTSPERMEQVRSLIKKLDAELALQVSFEVRVLEFRSNLGRDRGIDWSVLKDVGGGSLGLNLSNASSLVNGTVNGLSFAGSGKWDGTDALIKALETQGVVSTETPITAITMNNQPVRLSQTLDRPYISEIETDVSDGVVTASITRDVEREGVDMMIVPRISNDHVSLRLSGKFTKNVSESTEDVHGTMIKFFETRVSDLNFTNRLRFGETVVVGSIQQRTETTENSKNFGSGLLGAESVNTQIVETLVLLTPRKVEI
ncbi:MAG: hypothetical protein R3Y10_07065 [Ferrimonas sp.]